MFSMITRNWWAIALRGVVAIIFGILAIGWPGKTILTLVMLIGAYLLVDGIVTVIGGISKSGSRSGWWMVIPRGAAGIIVGIMIFVWPGVSAFVLLYLFAAWEIVTGIFEIMAGFQLRRAMAGGWLMFVAGAASIIFGVVLILFPGAGALSLIFLLGGYSIAYGVLLLVLAFTLRSIPPESTAVASAG